MKTLKTDYGITLQAILSVDVGWSKERLIAVSDHHVFFEALNSGCIHCDTCQTRLRNVVQLVEKAGIKAGENYEDQDGWIDEVAAWDDSSRQWHYFIGIPLPKEHSGREVEYLQKILDEIPIQPLTRF